eukprot:scaffold34940_cov246-Amphora_coffeaeformis.AAC.4
MVYNNWYTPGPQSIIPHRPDVLRCSEDNHLFYLSSSMRYHHMDSRSNNYISFNPDGTYYGRGGESSKNYLCAGKSLQELEYMGLAYNMVSSTEKDTDEDNDGFTSSVDKGVPDAITCDNSKMFYRSSYANDVFWTLDNTVYNQYLGYEKGTGKAILGLNRGSQISSCEYKSLDALYDEGKAFNFVTTKEADETGITSVHAGWPDLITCGSTLFYLSHDKDDTRYYAQPFEPTKPTEFNGVRFSIDSKTAVEVPSDMDEPCIHKTIDDFYAEGQAYNLISGVGTARYFFEYTLEDHIFQDVNLTQVETDTFTSHGGGKLTNCAKGMATMERSVSLSIANEQSLSVSKSFTSTATTSFAVGYSVAASLSAHTIFVGASAAETAGLEVVETFSVSASRTDSLTLTTTSTIEFELSTAVEVKPETCSEYSLATKVSAEPVRVPYTALARMAVYDFDLSTGIRGPRVTDLGTLQNIMSSMNDDTIENYQANLDTADSSILFDVEGVYMGKYATNSETKVVECDLDCSSDDSEDDSEGVSERGSVNFATAESASGVTHRAGRFAVVLCSFVASLWLIWLP